MSDETKVRNEGFVEKTVSRIWNEIADSSNPYQSAQLYLHGYEITDLISRTSYAASLFLLFKGELPGRQQERLLETLLVAGMAVGPRHAAVRAGQLAGNGKTDPLHILPIGLSVLSGEAQHIPEVMKFLVRSCRERPEQLFEKFQLEKSVDIDEVLLGFGRVYGGRDLLTGRIADVVRAGASDTGCLAWGARMNDLLAPLDAGWLRVGVFAAAFLDLGFPARVGGVVYQMLCAPSIAAYGLEMHGLPRTSMPFLSDDKYILSDRHE